MEGKFFCTVAVCDWGGLIRGLTVLQKKNNIQVVQQ